MSNIEIEGLNNPVPTIPTENPITPDRLEIRPSWAGGSDKRPTIKVVEGKIVVDEVLHSG